MEGGGDGYQMEFLGRGSDKEDGGREGEKGPDGSAKGAQIDETMKLNLGRFRRKSHHYPSPI